MKHPPTVSVHVLVPSDARATITEGNADDVTVFVTGQRGVPSLSFQSLRSLEDWILALSHSVVDVHLVRASARTAIAEMDATLRRAGVAR